MRVLPWLLAASSIVVVAACSPLEIDGGQSSYARALEDRVERHTETCQEADDVDEIEDETDEYDEDVRVWADDVAACRTMMGMRCCCCGPGGRELSDDVTVEVTRHGGAMRASAGLNEVKEECRSHRESMRTILSSEAAR